MERIQPCNQNERLAIIRLLKDSKNWSIVTTVESSDNRYYLFCCKNNGDTIAINDGQSDFYDDVVRTNVFTL